ncbi:MAG: lysylphosphatidylglycerol synthase transmembrane domain-containing protein [Phycisphaerae bacterium]
MNPKTKKVLGAAVRLLVAAGLIAYVLSQARLRDAVRPAPGEDARPIVRRTDDGCVVRAENGSETLIPYEAFGRPEGPVLAEGILSIARRLTGRWWWAAAALGAMMLQSPLGAVRWRLLLAVQGIHITFTESLRLTYIGWFFNNWLPGATGGDFVKAYYIAAQTHRKAEAVTVVFLDRFLGLVSVCIVGAVALTASLSDPRVRIAQVVMGTFMAGVILGTVVFYSRRVRTLLRVDRLIARLPLAKTVAKVDRALFVYRYHKRKVARAVLYSWGTQVGSILAMWWVAVGLGSRADWDHYFLNMPVVWIGWALVPVPGGFGVAESLMQHLFGPAVLGGTAGPLPVGEAATLALAMMLAFRLVQMTVSVPGAIFYLARRTGVSPTHMREELEEEDENTPSQA